MSEEVLEQGELTASQWDIALPDRDSMGRRVKLESTGLQDVGALDGASPGEGAEAREELGEGEGLDEVVVRADIQTTNPIFDSTACGQQQDRRPVACRAEVATQGKAVTIRQHDVEDKHVMNAFIGHPPGVFHGRHDIDGVPLPPQPPGYQGG